MNTGSLNVLSARTAARRSVPERYASVSSGLGTVAPSRLGATLVDGPRPCRGTWRGYWIPSLMLVVLLCGGGRASGAGGITPEQIYQAAIDLNSLVGTWEVLPDDDPLAEKGRNGSKPPQATLMTLRKDGTCRVFGKEHPLGSDGLWTFSEHEISITLPNRARLEFYVYGVRGDFMVTRSKAAGGQDRLWGRVK